MKKLRLAFLITLVCILGRENLYSQSMNWDENFTTTVLYDDFLSSQLDSNKWSVEDDDYTYTGVIIDSSATVSVNSDNLKLSIIHCPDCSRNGETKNMAGGEIYSNKSFQYGIFECSAKINLSLSSVPKFCFIGGNGNDCASGNYYATEVDIFLTVDPLIGDPQLQHKIYHHHPGNDCKKDYRTVDLDYQLIRPALNDYFDYYHTYKCVWTPEYIRYYIDGNLKHEITNTGAQCPECDQNWFPSYFSKVHLCNLPNVVHTHYASTYFDWVSVKRFFATPRITMNSYTICTNGSASLNVDPDATGITWSLSPTSFFSGNNSGTGRNASFNISSGASGEAKITYTFEMPGGESFDVEKSFWVGEPNASEIDYINIGPNYPGSMVLCDDMPNDGKVKWSAAGDVLEYSWSVYDDGNTTWQVQQHPMAPFAPTPMEDVQFSKPYGSVNGNVSVKIKARNTCGWSQYKQPALQFSTSNCAGMMLGLSPNPTSSETVLSIENKLSKESSLSSASSKSTFDEDALWDLEVYDHAKSLKFKKSELKGKVATINTLGWKEGVYIVIVKYKEEILQSKLIVKE